MFDARPLLAFLGALLLPLCAVAADALQPEDFGWGQRLLVDGREPFYRLALPDAVYNSAAWPDLRDVRVFNANGEQLPHALVGEPNTSRASVQSTELQAWRVPVDGGSDRSSAGRLRMRHEGMDLQWSSSEETKRPQLLLVVPGADQVRTLSSIKLDWHASTRSWQQSVTVESSNDLTEWTLLASALPLMDLLQNGQHLRIDTLRFPEAQARYWRLTLDPSAVPTLKSATGIYQTEAWTTALRWLSPGPQEREADGHRIYRFPLAQPAEFLRIHLPQDNSVVPYTLQYRSSAKDSWQTLPDAVAWRLQLNGEMRESPWRELNGIQIAELRLFSNSGWGAGEPSVELGRRSQHLLFNARGNGPWLLTWGAAAASQQSLPAQTLIPDYSEERLLDLPEATAAEPVTLGGEQRRLEPGRAERQARWQTRILWALLVAGAAGLAWLALKLWREMPRDTPPQPDA